MPVSSLGDFPDQGIKLVSPALANAVSITEPLGKSLVYHGKWLKTWWLLPFWRISLIGYSDTWQLSSTLLNSWPSLIQSSDGYRERSNLAEINQVVGDYYILELTVIKHCEVAALFKNWRPNIANFDCISFYFLNAIILFFFPTSSRTSSMMLSEIEQKSFFLVRLFLELHH